MYERGLVIACFVLILFGTFDTLFMSAKDSRTEGTPLFQALSASIYFAGVVTLLCRGIPKWLFKVLWRAAPLIFLLLLTVVSTIWSQDPESTLRRAVALLMSSSFAVYVVSRFDLRTLFNLLTISFLIFAIVGVVAAFSGAGIIRTGAYSGAWQGLVGQKNDFGRTLALAIALIPAAVLLGLTDWRKTAVVTSFAAVGMLFLAQSATALAAGFASVGVGPVFYLIFGGTVRGIRLQIELRIVLALFVVATGIFVGVWGQPLVLDLLGRSPTLTGRTELWQWALVQNEDRMWLGSGYRAFWIDDNTRYFFEFFAWHKGSEGERSDSYSGPSHSHSGYIDTLLDLGILGIAMLGVTLASGLVHLRRTLSYGNNEAGLIFAIVTSFLFTYAYAARSFLQHSEDLWFLFSVFFMFIVKEEVLSETKLQRALQRQEVRDTLPLSLARNSF